MKPKISIGVIFFISCFFSFSLHTKERWILDKELSKINFELPIFLMKNVKGEFKQIEGLVEIDIENKENNRAIFSVAIDSIEMNYKDLIKRDNNSILSPGVFQNHALPKIKKDEKVCIIIVDCMRCDQFLSVIPYLESLFNIELTYHMSLIPSATPYSRNAIFSGLYPDELIKKYPNQKNYS